MSIFAAMVSFPSIFPLFQSEKQFAKGQMLHAYKPNMQFAFLYGRNAGYCRLFMIIERHATNIGK
ncbi:hypothetical protein RRF57_003079 [Xylaria bambusicola]|uniref:Uncharacterized protein n=1 Tax=Xylaria bambusicola TaxID=326684 RepID=A0AAN7UTR3_9PEZI